MKPDIEETDFHGLAALRLAGPDGSAAVIARRGGQVVSWTTADGRERLYLSPRAVFDGSCQVRGGIPVCFPQFAGQGVLPKHGLLRTREWVESARRCGNDFALVTLEAAADDASLAVWPHAFRVELTVMIEAGRLDLELCVVNPGVADFSFTGALHTYLRVVQVEDVAIEGLHGHTFIDSAQGGHTVRETGTEILVEGEVDRIYRNVRRPQLLRAGNLSLGIAQQGFPDTVVWNPWVDKCAALDDMPADGWRHMLCIEAAAAGEPVVVPAGGEWYGRQTLVVV
jgi:glucose-6-phosphate 1-epimerase